MVKRGRPPNVQRQEKMLRMRARGYTYAQIGAKLVPPVAGGTVATFFRRLRLKCASSCDTKESAPG